MTPYEVLDVLDDWGADVSTARVQGLHIFLDDVKISTNNHGGIYIRINEVWAFRAKNLSSLDRLYFLLEYLNGCDNNV